MNKSMKRGLYRLDERPGTFRLRLYGGLFLFILLLGTAGYRWIEGWSLQDCLYMTVITVSSVGYGEVHALSQHGQLFTIALIFFLCNGCGVIAHGLI